MRKLLPILCLCGAFVAAPAIAKDHPGTGGAHHGGGSTHCKTHSSAYRVNGTLVTATLTKIAKHDYSGTITITVRTANHAASGTTSSNQSYTFTHAKVRFGHGVNQTIPAAGSRVQLKGTITYQKGSSCPPYGITMVTIDRVTILAAQKPHHHG
jgi:hypothetical protein